MSHFAACPKNAPEHRLATAKAGRKGGIKRAPALPRLRTGLLRAKSCPGGDLRRSVDDVFAPAHD